jgi:tetratricopeptide (TPR) repeat protein
MEPPEARFARIGLEPDAPVELDPDSREELTHLFRFLDVSDRFDLFFLRFDAEVVLDFVTTALRGRYGERLVVCALPAGQADVDPLVELMHAVRAAEVPRPIFLLRGLDAVLGPFGERTLTLRLLNERRDLLPIHVPGPLVVALRPQQLQQLREHAPDLWSIYTAVCRVRGTGLMLPRLPGAAEPWLDDPQVYRRQIDKLRALPGDEPTRLRARLQHKLALALAAHGDLASAERSFAEGLDAARAAAEAEAEAALLISRGDVRRRAGDLEAAQRDLRDARAIPPGALSPALTAALHRGDAELAADRSDYPEAVRHLGLAQAAFERAGHVEDALSCLVAEGHLLLMLAQMEAAEARFSEAARQAREHHAPHVEGLALAGQAEKARAQGDRHQAERLYAEALAIFDRLGHAPGQAHVHTGLARASLGSGNLEAALGSARRAAELFAQLGDRLGEAQALMGQGRVLSLQERHAEATDVLARAAELFTRVGHGRGQAEVELTRGVELWRAGRLDEALHVFRDAAQSFRALSLSRDEASALRSAGDVLLALGRADEAVDCFKRALALAAEDLSPGDAALTWWSLGSVWRESDPSRALEAWRQAERLARRLALDDLLAHVLGDMGRLQLDHPKLATDGTTAHGVFEEALTLARRSGETRLAQRLERWRMHPSSSRQ